MSDGRGKQGEDFASLLGGAKALAGRDRQAPPPVPKPKVKKAQSGPGFVLPDPNNPLLCCATDCDRKLLARLRAGRIPFTITLDLHGLRKQQALEELQRGLQQAWEEGEDCVLVIHGRSLGATTEPVLKRALPSWLTQAPIGAHVLAFAPSKQRDGGPGATYVLLRCA